MNALAHTATHAGNPVVPALDVTHAHPERAQYLTFMLGEELFAIGILAIKEIIEYSSLTTVPMMPPAVRGVINLRGAVVPVMDLSACFGRGESPVSKRTCIVIVEVRSDHDRHDVGVMVDAVNEVLEIAASDIESPPAFGSSIRRSFVSGMGKVAGRFVILLNVDQVLSADEQALSLADAQSLRAPVESGVPA